jgi:hypothetical protein
VGRWEKSPPSNIGGQILADMSPDQIEATAAEVELAFASGGPFTGRIVFNLYTLACLRQGLLPDKYKSGAEKGRIGLQGEFINGEFFVMTYDVQGRYFADTKKFGGVRHAAELRLDNGEKLSYLFDPAKVFPVLKEMPRATKIRLAESARDYAVSQGTRLERARHTGAIMLALYHVRRGRVSINHKELKVAVDFYTRHSTSDCWNSYRYYVRGVLGGVDCV